MSHRQRTLEQIPTISAVIDRFRQPEYTGENRCLPCTAVNLVIAAVFSGGLVYVISHQGLEGRLALLLGVSVFTVCTGVIYVRGYLVPYTPTITKRYFPDWLLSRFEKTPNAGVSPAEDGESIDIEQLLIENELLTECEQHDDWCLAAPIKRRWWAAMEVFEEIETRRSAIAELLAVDEESLSVNEYGDAAVVTVDGQTVGQWESDAAFLADLAANEVLTDEFSGWSGMKLDNRSQVLHSLRMFLEQCPMCNGQLSMGHETVESCCRAFDVVAVTCHACEARLFEIEITENLPQDET